MQKVSLIDYPGKIATVLFTRGCVLRCRYCHNPELVLPELFQGPISENYVFELLESRKNNIEGVVITGGEPTIHKDLLQFIKRIKDMGYMVKLDSSGVFPEVLEAAINSRLVDYIAMDIKAPLEKYDLVTGTNVNPNVIKRSIRLIMDSGIDYEFRTTIVKSLLSADDIVEIAKMISGSKKYAMQRFVSSRTVDPAFEAEITYTTEELEKVKPLVERYVVVCSIR